MANVLPSLTVLAQEALSALQPRVPLFSAFSNNFSNEVKAQGDTVGVYVPSGITALDYTKAGGYTGVDVGGNTTNIALNKVKYAPAFFTDAEYGNLTPQRLISTFNDVCINGVVNAVQSDLFSLIVSGTYGAASYRGTSYTLQNTITTPLAALNTAGVGGQKASVFNSTAYYGIVNDTKQYAIADPALLSQGRTPTLAGTTFLEAPALPTNSQNLVGFVAGKDALGIATRIPGIPDAPNVETAEVVDPNSGLTIQVRHWYSADKGLHCYSAHLIYGVAAVNTSALKMICSA